MASLYMSFDADAAGRDLGTFTLVGTDNNTYEGQTQHRFIFPNCRLNVGGTTDGNIEYCGELYGGNVTYDLYRYINNEGFYIRYGNGYYLTFYFENASDNDAFPCKVTVYKNQSQMVSRTGTNLGSFYYAMVITGAAENEIALRPCTAKGFIYSVAKGDTSFSYGGTTYMKSQTSTPDPQPSTTCTYQIYVDNSPIDSDIFSNIESDPSATTSFSDKSFVLALDRSASHTVKMIDLTTGLVSSSADWKVNDSTTLPSGWTKSNGILTIPANATANSDNIDPYNIEGTVGECSEDMKIRIVASSQTVPTIEDTGLGVGMTTGNITQYIAYYSNEGTFKTNETGTATGLPVSLTAKEGLTVSTADNKFIVSVPYDSAGYKFCVLDSSDIDDDGDPVVDALEGFVAENATTHYGILWGVRFPDGTGTAVRHYTRIPISDAGEYEITALACNGNLAKSDNVDTIYVQIVNTIRLTVLPVINVSWIACSYEG